MLSLEVSLTSSLPPGLRPVPYYRATQDGPGSVVVPIDELSVLVTVLDSSLILREAVCRRYLIGLALLVGGTRAAVVP